MTDTERLDFLEREMKEDPLLLHNTNGPSEWPTRPRGLGLLPWAPRSLREAIDSMAGLLKPEEL